MAGRRRLKIEPLCIRHRAIDERKGRETLVMESQYEKLQKRRQRLFVLRNTGLFLSAFLIFSLIGAVGVYAYMKWTGGAVQNNFEAEASVNPVIEETFDQKEKTNGSVAVKDTGYSVYVRAAVVVTWKNQRDQVYSLAPIAGEDYEIQWNLTEPGWSQGADGFYYYGSAVESGGKTGVLIASCKPLKDAPEDGYTLDVQIIAQTIQTAGTTDTEDITAVQDAWGVSF